MKAKNILMSILLVMGAIAAKAAGYPPELALVSQPVMVYNANSITVYYDVENIGDYTYRGSVYLYLSPDEGYYYADEWIKVRPGRIKRIAIDIPAYRIRKGYPFTIMPYYELDDELYSFTTFEYFEPITFFWEGPRNERWVVIHVGPCPRYYNRPGSYRYYYDGFRPPMPPPPGHGPATPPPPMDPKHHTYGYHNDHGGYPTNHFSDDHGPKPEHGDAPKPNNNGGATVRPKPNAGSMSGGHNSNSAGSNSGSVKPNNPAPNGSNSGRTPSSGSNRPSSNSSNSNVSRPSSNGSSSGNVSRPSSNNGSSRPSGTSNNSSSVRKSNSSVSSSSSGTRSSSSTSTRSSSSSSSSSNSRGSSSGASRR